MMKTNKKILLIGALLFTLSACDKHGDHDHANDTNHEHTESEHEEGEHGHDHGEEGEENNEEFEVSAKAYETFNLKFKDFSLQKNGDFFLPKSALFYNLDEVAIYRLRDKKFKRVHFSKIKKEGENTFIRSDELANGDQIVLEGVGFLRMVELANSGGLDHGHSH